MFQWRTFVLAKDVEHPEHCQDAWGSDPSRGIAVVADGVSSAIFSRPWAEILVRAVLADPPYPSDPAGFSQWLASCRAQWEATIDTENLTWYQAPKMAEGAFSTLLWVRLFPTDQTGRCNAHVFAIGDSCLFHFRDGALLRTFPLENSAQLEAAPIVLGSRDLGRDHLMQFAGVEIDCLDGDLMILCSDAIAEWTLRTYEAGETIDWSRYWSIPDKDWAAEITALRESRAMAYDDSTLVMLHVTSEGEIPPGAEPADSRAKEPDTPTLTRKWWNPFGRRDS